MATVHPALAPYVRSIVVYDVTFGAPGVHIGMPSTGLTFVLPLGEPLEVAWDAAPQTRTSGWSSVSGLHTTAAAVHHGLHQCGIQLSLSPAGARALWGIPAGALAGELLALGDVDTALDDLPERLAGEATWGARLAVLERALLGAVHRRERPGTRPEVARAMALLTRGVPVAATADDVGYSRRRLSTLVRDEVGVSPKTYQRLARFSRAHGRLRRDALDGDARWHDWPPRAGTPTRPTSPVSGPASPGAARRSGCGGSSPSFKPRGTGSREPDVEGRIYRPHEGGPHGSRCLAHHPLAHVLGA